MFTKHMGLNASDTRMAGISNVHRGKLANTADCRCETNILMNETVIHVLRMGRKLQNSLEKLFFKAGITYNRFIILELLRMSAQPIQCNVLADKAGVSSPTISIMISGMIEKGLVERSSSPSDKRVVQIKLSSKGRTILDEVRPLFFDWQAKAMAKIAEKDFLALSGILSKISPPA